MPEKVKMFKLKLKLEEVIHGDDMIVFPIFSSSQTIVGIANIKPILDDFDKQLLKFIDISLNKIKT